MLILTRRIGESVYIGDEVRLTVLGVRGTQVRIGINAPKDIPVHREEIYYKIKHEQTGETPRSEGQSENANEGQSENGNESESDQQGNRAEVGAGNNDDASADYDESQPSAEEADPNNA